MKKLLYLLTGLCLLAGLFTSCEKPNATNEESGGIQKENYTEKAFGMHLEMVYVEGGEFEMGATSEQGKDVNDDEKPVRRIKLDGYHIGKYEITQAQWKAVMGTEPSYFMGSSLPVERVSWEDAQEFCKKLSEATDKRYLLPTEAQWEYAARGGNKSKHYKYAGSNDIEEVAWYNSYGSDEEYPGYGTKYVGMKRTNELGIYDMSGNISEWCLDWYGKYDENDTENTQGPTTGSYRVFRGGSWYSTAGYCRVSGRYGGPSNFRLNHIGFRVACVSE